VKRNGERHQLEEEIKSMNVRKGRKRLNRNEGERTKRKEIHGSDTDEHDWAW
jgi:hypothetical protein